MRPRPRFRDMPCAPVAPIYLGATVVVRAGSQASPNPLALKSPDSYPLAIHEIQFGFRTPNSSGLPLVSSNNVAVQLSLGAYKVTSSFIPLGLFPDQAPTATVSTGTDQQGFNFVWRLDSPLYLPPGAILVPTFRNVGQSQNDATVFVQYNCSVLPALPRMVSIPYVSAWTGKSLVFANADTDNSAENDLVNDTDSPLVLDKLTGVAAYIDSSTSIAIDHDLQYARAGGSVGQIVQLKIHDSDDRAIVDTFTAWDLVFPYGSRKFPIRGVTLAQRKYLKVYVNKLAPGLALSGDQLQLSVAMFGHRDVRGS